MGEEISSEEYNKYSNTMAIGLAEIGISFADRREEFFSKILELADNPAKDELDVEEELFNLIFECQLTPYLDGVALCISEVTRRLAELNLKGKFFNIDTAVHALNQHTGIQEEMYTTCSKFAEHITEEVTTYTSDIIVSNIGGIASSIRTALDLFCEGSFVLGLTDCRGLYYTLSMNPDTGVSVEQITPILDKVFPALSM